MLNTILWQSKRFSIEVGSHSEQEYYWVYRKVKNQNPEYLGGFSPHSSYMSYKVSYALKRNWHRLSNDLRTIILLMTGV